MDAKGIEMSKSVGNTVDPLKVMEAYGADIIRLWALSVDFTEDHRIGDEISAGSPTNIASCATPSAISWAGSTGSARPSGSGSRRCPSSSATCSI